MGLLDDLRAIENFPPSHLPTPAEALQVIGTLVAYIEHGEQLLEAIAADAKARQDGEPTTHVDELLSPPPQPEPQASPSPTPAAAPAAVSAGDIQAAQEQANAQAVAQQTRVEVAPGAGEGNPPAPDAPSTSNPEVQ